MHFQKSASVWLGHVAVAVLFATLTAAQVRAQNTAALPQGVTRVQTVEGITEYRLTNGLKVLLAPDVADDRVTVNLTYLVGSRHEGYGESGMAHLLEHMIFKGTPTTPDPKAEFRQRGFTFNGTTTADRTNYFATFASNQESLDWYLGWQADAMVHSFIAKKDLDSEMPVVRSEFEIGENNPFQALGQRVRSVSYLWHGYGKSTIGAKSDIENVDIGKLQAFYHRYYRPDDAVLIVAGKFDVAKTLASVQTSLGAVPKPAAPIPHTFTLEPAQDGERSVMVRRPSTTQLLMASYHTPSALHPDSIALQVLAAALSDAPSGRLYKALVETKLAQAVIAISGGQRETSSIVFATAFGSDDDATVRQKLLLDIVENLSKEPINQDEFDRAKIKINKSLELGFANAAAVANGAMGMEVMGDWRAVFVGRERMKTVTLDDVNRVARTYLLPDNRTLGHLIPTPKPVRAPAMQMPDVAAYLQGYTLSEKGLESVAFDFSPASLHEKVVFATTSGGMKTATLAKPVRGDLVQMQVHFKFGSLESLRGQDVASHMARAMLDKGTPKLTRQQIQDQLNQLGAALNLNFSPTGGNLSLTAKQEDFPAALKLALHLLKESSFPEKEFEEIRAAKIKDVEGQIKDKSAQANNAWGRYGKPYAKDDIRYQHTHEEWLQELKSVTRDQAFDFYKRFYGAQSAQISLLGPVDQQEYSKIIASELDSWTAPETWHRVERPMFEREPARLVYDTPDKANVSLRAIQSLPVSARGMDAEYYGLELATRIFGGGPGSRLWVRLRETGGLSYSAGAAFSASPYESSASLSLSSEVAPSNLGLAEKALQEELARSLNEGFTAAEVEKFKQIMIADRLRARSGDAYAMSFVAYEMEFDNPKDRREKHDALIAALTPEEVNAVWRKFVKPEQLVWGIFGDQSKIKW